MYPTALNVISINRLLLLSPTHPLVPSKQKKKIGTSHSSTISSLLFFDFSNVRSNLHSSDGSFGGRIKLPH